VTRLAPRVPVEPGVSLGAGLVVLVVAVWLLLGGGVR